MAARVVTPSYLPGVMQVAHVSFGYTTDCDVRSTSTGAFTIFQVPSGLVVTNLLVHKVTAFDSTGSPTVDIGDGTDEDGFIESTDLVASDAGLVTAYRDTTTTGGLSDVAFRKGKVFVGSDETADSDGYYDIKVTVATAPHNAGKADIYLTYFMKGEVNF